MRKGDRGIITNHRADPELVYERPGKEYTGATLRRKAFTALNMNISDELLSRRDPEWEANSEVLRIDVGYCLDRSF